MWFLKEKDMAVTRLRLIALLLLLVLAAVVLAAWLGYSKPVRVAVKTAGYGLVQDTVANTRAGTVKACHRAGLSPPIGGQVARLPVQEGDRVVQGQVLMEFWNEDRAAEVALARSEVVAARARARQSCVMAELAQREAQRLRRLRRSELVSEEAVDKADSDARGQQAACRAAQASIGVAQGRLKVAEAVLERTRLTAPFAGIVAEVNGELGEFVTPSPVGVPTPPAVDLVDIGCLYVSAPIDEVDAPRIRVGMSASIALDAFPGKRFAGRVRRTAPYVLDVEKQARTVDVEVEFLHAADTTNMLPGYSADIEVILARRDKALRIPTEALLEGNRVLVLGADGVLQQRQVETGLGNWVWTEVTSGLQAGDEVVVSLDREGVAAGARAERDD